MKWFGFFLFALLIIGVILSPNCNTYKDELTPPDTTHNAHTYIVRMPSMKFVPETLLVKDGDTVIWINDDVMAHTTTSGINGVWDSIWDSGDMPVGDSFKRVFTVLGDYPYFCTYHYPGMSGLVKVNPTDTFKLLITNNIKLQWRIEAESLHVIMSAPCTGWFSIGFESLPNNQMQGVNYIIGYVTNDSIMAIQDNYGDSPISHVSDISLGGADNIKAIKGTETGGRTELEFKIPLNSGDIYDVVLTKNTRHSIQLAYGSLDDFESMHDFDVVVTITL